MKDRRSEIAKRFLEDFGWLKGQFNEDKWNEILDIVENPDISYSDALRALQKEYTISIKKGTLFKSHGSSDPDEYLVFVGFIMKNGDIASIAFTNGIELMKYFPSPILKICTNTRPRVPNRVPVAIYDYRRYVDYLFRSLSADI